MTQVTNFATTPQGGIDLNNVYVVSASLTPETPAPPFALGTEVIGLNGAQYLFVQASASISANDFVAITGANQANSLTNTNAVAAGGVRIGVAPGAPVVTSTGIAAASYFWAALNGSALSANGVAASTTSNVQLYTTAVAGAVASVTGSSGVALGGVIMTASATANPQTFELTWPRLVAIYSSTSGTGTGGNNP